MFSSPCEILTPSTTVSIDGNVHRIFSDGTPTSNGVYRFGSNVSGDAMPPAIHNRMHVSALAGGCSIFSASVSAARADRGSSSASVASAAADIDCRKHSPRNGILRARIV